MLEERCGHPHAGSRSSPGLTDPSLVIVGAVACGIAGVLWLLESKVHRAHARWCAARTKAEGVISRIARRGHLSRNEPTTSDEFFLVPIVRFRAVNGVEYEIDAPGGAGKVGAPIQVAYDPALPSDGRVVPRTRKLGCVVVILAIGIALLGWGLLHEGP